jgi:hypothetical protein
VTKRKEKLLLFSKLLKRFGGEVLNNNQTVVGFCGIDGEVLNNPYPHDGIHGATVALMAPERRLRRFRQFIEHS